MNLNEWENEVENAFRNLLYANVESTMGPLSNVEKATELVAWAKDFLENQKEKSI